MKLINSNNPILKQRALDWNFDEDGDPHLLEKDMISLMVLNNGRGLAANQIGLLKRVFVIQLVGHQNLSEPFAMFNPQVLNQSEDTDLGEEGCLSFPGLFLSVKRPKTIEVEYFDATGKSCIIALSGIDARCFMHELDHLNGVCFTDNISPLKLALAKKKQRKYNGRT